MNCMEKVKRKRYKNISMSDETYMELDKLGRYKETHEDILKRLLKTYQKYGELKEDG